MCSFMLSITAICVSRIMLGLRSLAADLVTDPQLLLNNTELSRVPWRKGANAGEFMVYVEDRGRQPSLDINVSTRMEMTSVLGEV